MIIPTHRLNLNMFSQHIKSETFHFRNIKYHSLIRRRRKSSVAPIALIQKSLLEIRFIVKEKTCYSLFVTPYCELSHAEIAFNRIYRFISNGNGNKQIIKFGIFGRPIFVLFKLDFVMLLNCFLG